MRELCVLDHCHVEKWNYLPEVIRLKVSFDELTFVDIFLNLVNIPFIWRNVPTPFHDKYPHTIIFFWCFKVPCKHRGEYCCFRRRRTYGDSLDQMTFHWSTSEEQLFECLKQICGISATITLTHNLVESMPLRCCQKVINSSGYLIAY
jgi:hypothetical protein